MAILRDALARIANGAPSVVVSDLPDVKSVDGSKLLLKVVGRSTGLRRTSSDFAEKVDVLSRSNHPGHQYLEIVGTEDAIVEVSSDEYPDNLIP